MTLKLYKYTAVYKIKTYFRHRTLNTLKIKTHNIIKPCHRVSVMRLPIHLPDIIIANNVFSKAAVYNVLSVGIFEFLYPAPADALPQIRYILHTRTRVLSVCECIICMYTWCLMVYLYNNNNNKNRFIVYTGNNIT